MRLGRLRSGRLWAVATASYRLLPEVTLAAPVKGDDAEPSVVNRAARFPSCGTSTKPSTNPNPNPNRTLTLTHPVMTLTLTLSP